MFHQLIACMETDEVIKREADSTLTSSATGTELLVAFATNFH